MIDHLDSITVVRPATSTDAYGSTVYDWANATRTVVHGVAVLPMSQHESGTGVFRDVVTTGWRVYSKPGLDIDLTAYDRVEWRGLDLEVVGEVARWPHPLRRGAIHHIEASLQRRTG